MQIISKRHQKPEIFKPSNGFTRNQRFLKELFRLDTHCDRLSTKVCRFYKGKSYIFNTRCCLEELEEIESKLSDHLQWFKI